MHHTATLTRSSSFREHSLILELNCCVCHQSLCLCALFSHPDSRSVRLGHPPCRCFWAGTSSSDADDLSPSTCDCIERVKQTHRQKTYIKLLEKKHSFKHKAPLKCIRGVNMFEMKTAHSCMMS